MGTQRPSDLPPHSAAFPSRLLCLGLQFDFCFPGHREGGMTETLWALALAGPAVVSALSHGGSSRSSGQKVLLLFGE